MNKGLVVMDLGKYQKYSRSIIRIGLGLVFLANAYTAFASPDDFTRLIGKSLWANLLPVSLDVFVKFIGISDGLVAALLIVGKGGKFAAGYATLWLMGVMAAIGFKEPADLLEHFGFLSMALYLVVNSGKREEDFRKEARSAALTAGNKSKVDQ